MSSKGPILHQNLALIEVQDKLILDALYSDRQASGSLLTRLSDRVAVVDARHWQRLQKRLPKLGYLPKVLRDGS